MSIMQATNFPEPNVRLNTNNYTFPSTSDEQSSGPVRGNTRVKNVNRCSNGDIVSMRPDVRPRVDPSIDEISSPERQKSRRKYHTKMAKEQNENKSMSKEHSFDSISVTSTITIGALPVKDDTSSVAGKRSVKSLMPSMQLVKETAKNAKRKIQRILQPQKLCKRKSEETILDNPPKEISVIHNIQVTDGRKEQSPSKPRPGSSNSTGSTLFMHKVREDYSDTSDADDSESPKAY